MIGNSTQNIRGTREGTIQYSEHINMVRANYSSYVLKELVRLRLAILNQTTKLKKPDIKAVCSSIKIGNLKTSEEFLLKVWNLSGEILKKVFVLEEDCDLEKLAAKMSHQGAENSKEFLLFQIAMAELVEDSLPRIEFEGNDKSKTKKHLSNVTVVNVSPSDSAAAVCFKNGLSIVYYLAWVQFQKIGHMRTQTLTPIQKEMVISKAKL